MIEKIFETTSRKAADASPLGGKLKFMIGDEPIFIDGSGETNMATREDLPADTTITLSEENFLLLAKGELNPMMAVMMGKVKISGDMALALKVQSLI